MDSVIEKIKDRFDGNFIYFCDSISGKRINFEPNSVSLCHEATLRNRPEEVRYICDINNFTIERYYEHIYHLLESFQKESYPCRQCPLCTLKEFHFEAVSFVVVGLSHSCNCNCIYCDVRVSGEKEGYEIAPLIESFAQKGLISQDVLFDWGGGEPTSHIGFEEAVNEISSYGFRQRIHTNGIIFSAAAYNALVSGAAILFISVDSGTREVFERVKGHSKYEEVWKSVARYAECSPDNVYVKYNVMNYNSDSCEIDAFLDQCQKAHVKNVVISAEISSYCVLKNAGPFYFTDKEFRAAHYMYRRAEDMGFNVLVAKFAFQVRGEFGGDGKLKLPKSYFDNIDYEALSRGIMVEAFPTVESILAAIPTDEIIVYCGGGWGTLAYRAFSRAGKTCILIGNDVEPGTMIDGCTVLPANKFLVEVGTEKVYYIIVAGSNVQEIVSRVNHSEINAKLFWAAGAAYRKFLGRV